MGVCVAKPIEVHRPALLQECIQSKQSDDDETAIDERIPEGFNPKIPPSLGERNCHKVFANMTKTSQSPFQSLLDSWEVSGFLSVINSRVFSVQPSDAKTTSKLAHSLTNKCYDMQELNDARIEIMKAYMLYFWIINNINYDMNKLTNTNSCSATLAKRCGTADEIASLFDALCAEARLKSQKLKGNLKTWQSMTGQSFQLNQQNCHSWNMVTVGRLPVLIDCVLGSGYVNSSSCFVKAPSNCYFAVPPHFLILTHWPTNPSEQFLKVPLSFDEMQPIIPVSMRVVRSGLHPQSWCEVIPLKQDSPDPVVSISVRLNSPTTSYLTAKLVLDSDKSEVFSCGELQAKTLIKCSGGNEYNVEAVVPTSGIFSLYVYMHSTERDHNRLDNFCLSYTIKADIETRLNAGYPSLYFLPAKVFGFSPLYWNIGKKSYEAILTNDVLIIVGKVKSDLLFDHCIIKGLVTSSSEAEAHRRYDYNTLLRQNRNKNLWKLSAVFPDGGWWTVCISATKSSDRLTIGYTGLLYYQVFVSKGAPELSYPQLFLQEILFDGRPVAATEDITTVSFTLPSSCTKFHHYLTYQQPSGDSWDGYTRIEIDHSNHYKLSAVFPKTGIWFIHVFSEAETESVGLFRLKLVVNHSSPNAFLVQTNLEQQNHITFIDGCMIRFLDDGKPFSFRFSWCQPDTVFLHSLKSQDGSIARYCSFLEKKDDDTNQTICTLNALFPCPGKWTVELFGSTDLIFEIKLAVANPVSDYKYPEMYPAFSELGCELSLADAQIRTCYDGNFRLPFQGPPNIYFIGQVESQQKSKDLSQQSFIHSHPDKREKILHLIFPAKGEWVVTLYAKSGDEFSCLLCVLVSNTTFKSDLSFPITLDSFYHPFKLYFSSDDLPLQSVIQVGAQPQTLKIKFYSPNKDVIFEHYAEVQSKGRRTSTDSIKSYKRVLTRMISNSDTHIYELQVEVAKPGKWSVFLYAKHSDDEEGLAVMQYTFSAQKIHRLEASFDN